MNGKKVLLAAAGVLILGAATFAIWKMTGEKPGNASEKGKSVSVTENPDPTPETQEEWAERIRQMRKNAESGGTVDFHENDLFTIRVSMKDVNDPVYIMTLTYKLGGDVMGMQTTAQYDQKPIENDPGFTLAMADLAEAREYESLAADLEAEARQRIVNIMTHRGAEIAQCATGRVYYRMTKPRSTFDSKGYLRAYPERVGEMEPFFKQSKVSRSFRPYFFKEA